MPAIHLPVPAVEGSSHRYNAVGAVAWLGGGQCSGWGGESGSRVCCDHGGEERKGAGREELSQQRLASV